MERKNLSIHLLINKGRNGRSTLSHQLREGVVHVASETLGFLANLSNSGAKLLLYYERRGLEENTVPEIMRICGIGSRTTYYKARSELLSLNLIGRIEGSTKTGLIGTESGLPTSPESVPASPKTVPVGVQKVDSGTKTGLPDKTWVEQAEEVDRLVGDGKREQQKLVVAGAWAEMFPDAPIHENTVAQFLGFAKWVCADVIGAMAVTQENGIEGKGVINYVRSTIQNPKWKKSAKQVNKDDAPKFTEQQIKDAYQFVLERHGKEAADSYIAELTA